MPLSDGTLSLHVHSTLSAKPKRAMIVRMSAETLDALQGNTALAFEFGDVPGIHIGDAFFSMRPQKEGSPHELYLRVASAAKPMAPLKLYANVIGKFMVERQLGDKVTDKVRQQTMVAKQQHQERQAILLDHPLLTAKNQKRKTPGSGTVAKKPPPPQRKASPQPSKASADLRRRLVHFLAIAPRLADDVVKMVGGASISASARDDLLALLDQIAEQPPAKKGDKSPRFWTLKPQSWTEVRPYEWPKLSESGRTAMARQARLKFKDLGIPDSDPAWEHVRYRATAPTIPALPPVASTSSNRSTTSAQPDAKRPVITAKETKQKSKLDPSRAKGEIQMKDESTKVRPNTTKRTEMEISTVKTVPSRRLPGSGYQVKKSPQPSTSGVEKPEPLPATLPQKPPSVAPPPGGSYARKTISALPPKAVKKEDESDRERDRELDRQREREREKREREKEKRREERERERIELGTRERLKQKEKERELAEREKRQSERERERGEIEPERRPKEKERAPKDKLAGGDPMFKRKSAVQGAVETRDEMSSKAPKRRKLDDGTAVATPKVREAELPNKSAHEPSPVPRFKMRKDPSPQVPVSQDRQTITSTSGSTHKSERPSKGNGSVKRRRSPIYTSSEDEGEIPQPRKRNPSPPPASERSLSSDQLPSDRVPSHRRAPRGFPPATDHAALRALYQSQYTTYLGTFSKVVAQKRKIEAMLNGDSEAEVDVMDPEELLKLSVEHKTLKNELEHIHDIYTQGTGVVSVSASD